jgi:MFS family permease
MNLLNYIDRYVFAAVGPAIMRDLGISKGGFGFLGSSFIIVYTIVSPLVGILGDRLDRRKILAFGVGLWSVATVGTAYAHSFQQMFLARAFLGIGESAFWVVGLPGLFLAAAGLMMREPGRGASDGKSSAKAAPPGLTDYLKLFTIPSYLLNTAGMAAVTFTTGAFGMWIPSYFEYVHHTKPETKAYLGIALAVGGLAGVLIGMWLPDRLYKITRRAYLLWAGFAVLLAIPFGAMGLLATGSLGWSLGLLTFASVLMSSCLGPCNTVTANVVPGSRRAMGYAVSIFLLHLFGDIPSPTLIGYVADRLGQPGAGSTPFGKFFEDLGAVPVPGGHAPTNITAGMLLIVPVLFLGSLCFFLGSRTLPRDQELARSAGEDDGAVLLH